MSGIVVVGAGMAGLLAGSMLRKDCPLILEARERLPHNHSAVLRFRSSIVGDTVGIPFRKVQAIKAVERWSNPIADTLSYSMKTNGAYTIRSSVTADAKVSERYIAPSDPGSAYPHKKKG
jgi:cation diffusion facilitator CzcD-associated flavoprotein CzcO